MIHKDEIFKIIDDYPKTHRMNKKQLYFRIGDKILKTFYKSYELDLLQIPIPNTFEIFKYKLIESNVLRFYQDIFNKALTDKIIDKETFEFLMDKVISILNNRQESQKVEEKKITGKIGGKFLYDDPILLIPSIIADLRLDSEVEHLSIKIVKAFLTSSDFKRFYYKTEKLGMCAGAIIFASKRLKREEITYEKVATIVDVPINIVKKWSTIISEHQVVDNQILIESLKITNFFHNDLEIHFKKGINVVLLSGDYLKNYNRPIQSKFRVNVESSIFEGLLDCIKFPFSFIRQSKYQADNWRIDTQLNVRNEIVQITIEYKESGPCLIIYKNLSSGNIIFKSEEIQSRFGSQKERNRLKRELREKLKNLESLWDIKDNYLNKSILNGYLHEIVEKKGFTEFMSSIINRNRYSIKEDKFNEISKKYFYDLFKNDKHHLKMEGKSLKIVSKFGQDINFESLTIGEIYKMIICLKSVFFAQTNGLYIIDEINEQLLGKEEILNFLEKMFKDRQLIILTSNREIIKHFSSANVINP